MQNVVKVVLSVFAAAFLLVLCFIIGTMSVAIAPVHLLCSLVLYSFGWCVALTKNVIAWAKDSVGLPRNKEVVFRVEPDSPGGIELSDIANGRCSKYNGVNLRGVLQYAIRNHETGSRAFPDDAPMCFVSGSGQHFLGCGDIIYPVQPPIKRPARLFQYRKRFRLSDYTCLHDEDDPAGDRDAVREVVLKTNFAVTGPRTNNVRLQYKNAKGSDISRLRLIVPSVALNKTRGMTPICVALLSPYVVPDDSESVFLRRYIALARVCEGEDGGIAHRFEKDIRANMRQFAHLCAYERGALSQVDTTFIRVSMNMLRVATDRSSECGVAELAQHSRHVLLLLGLSQSEDAMFKPLTEAGKVWLMSEFIHSPPFQDAAISAAMASMRDSIDRGIVSREDILKGMPYLCKQIPGLCEAIYTIVRAAKYGNNACEEGNLSNIALYSIANMLNKYGVRLPSVDEDSAFEGMNDRARRDFNTFVEQILRACRLSPHFDDTSGMCGTAWQVLQDGRCSNAIACLVAHRVSSLANFSGKSVSDLCIPATSDEFIIDYIQANSALRDRVPERWLELELADNQELEISSGIDIKVYKFPGLAYPPASSTLRSSSAVTAVWAESRATGTATGHQV